MKLTHPIHVCLIIFSIHYFDIIKFTEVRQESLHFDSTMDLIHYESISVAWAFARCLEN